jgi:hypothetical protein
MRKSILIFEILALNICFGVLFCVMQTGQALAAAPAYTATLIAGPYTIDVSLTRNPPFTDQPFEVIVGAHSGNQRFSGQVVAEPGLGTNAVSLHTQLLPLAGSPGKIGGVLHLPVRGAWQLVINVNGAQGPGSSSLGITVGAPGAIPPWLAWIIAAIPLSLIYWWVQRQRRYRHKLLDESKASMHLN